MRPFMFKTGAPAGLLCLMLLGLPILKCDNPEDDFDRVRGKRTTKEREKNQCVRMVLTISALGYDSCLRDPSLTSQHGNANSSQRQQYCASLYFNGLGAFEGC